VIRSMTGFAAVSREEQGQKVAITAKSVNHRFLDLSIKSPQSLSSLEGRIRAIVQQRLTRGRLELIVTLERSGEPTRDVVLNEALLERLGLAIEAVRAKGLVTGALTASDVLRLPQVLEIRQTIDAAGGLPEEVAALVEAVLVDAIDALVVMRETEGRFLRADLDARMQTMAGHVDAVEREAREGQRQLHDRLRERLADLPVDLQGDPAALAQEVVRFVARSDVDEELVRLRAHFDHWRELADGPEPCGRKLDFLVQEMNREINTIGSKAEGGRATEIVVSVKAELERIREQVQNVE
jgi:uncharacterized protein (TIGR00255 family)